MPGIAAADVLCCQRLNVHSQGESHEEAVTLLGRVDPQLAGDLAWNHRVGGVAWRRANAESAL